jgi:hypothetical protein
MTKKHLVLILVVLVGLIAYVHYFTDWFTPGTIQIIHTLRPPMPQKRSRPRSGDDSANVNVVSFALNGKFKLTELKVVLAADMATNKYPHAIWHLVSESNSVPLKAFIYGMDIKGMHSKITGIRPEALEAGVGYHLSLSAGELKGEYDFKTSERAK